MADEVKGEWIPRNRAPTDQQAAAFAKYLEEYDVQTDEMAIVAGIGWVFVPEGQEPPDLIINT